MVSNECIWQRGTQSYHMARRQAGFSLIELMVVVAIIAIIASVAYPGYQRYVVKSRRAAVEACMLQHAQLMERHYTTQLTYVGAAAPTCEANLANFYAVGFNGTVTARAYTIQAVPTASQPDGKCGTLTLDAQGVRTNSGSGTLAECW